MKRIALAVALGVALSAASAFAEVPRIFFTDLTSAPNTGGETVSGSSGAYVTLYGNGFGATQGSSTVTLGGGSCLRVVSWGQPWLWYQTIVVQLGSACASGDFSVTVGGKASLVAAITLNDQSIDPAAFTVRSSGNIYCVSTTGSDTNPGTFAGGCFATIPTAVHAVSAGDIIYVETGVTQSAADPAGAYDAAVALTSAGTSSDPIALLAYPGASAGVNTAQDYCVLTPDGTGAGSFWIIGGLSCVTSSTSEGYSFDVGSFRVIGNTLACANGTGAGGCMDLGGGSYQVYGNTITSAGTVGSSDSTYHGIDFSAANDDIDVGWNDVHGVGGCRGVEFYEEGVDGTDLHVHDNLIHDTVCDGIGFDGVNPTAGPVEAYNNVEYDVGQGPDPSDGAAIYSCVNASANGTYTDLVQIYNNSCLNAGNATTASPSQSGGLSLSTPTNLENNLIYQLNGQPYLTADAGCSAILSGATNDFFGNGAAPACADLTASANVDPEVLSTSTPDLHLDAGSPLIDAGTLIASLTWDHDGVPRPQAVTDAIGAYEYDVGTVPSTGTTGSTTAAASSSGTTSGATTASGTTAGATTGAAATTGATTATASSTSTAASATASATAGTTTGSKTSSTTAAATSTGANASSTATAAGTTGGSINSTSSSTSVGSGSSGSIGVAGTTAASSSSSSGTTGHHGGHNGGSTGASAATGGSGGTTGGSTGAIATAAASGSGVAGTTAGAAATGGSTGSTTSHPVDGTTGNGVQVVSTSGCGCTTAADPASLLALAAALGALRRRRSRT